MYTLADPDGTGTKHDDNRTAGTLQAAGLAGLVRAGVKVRCFCGKLSTAGINHFVAHLPAGDFLRTGDPHDGFVRIAHFLEGFIVAGLQALAFGPHFQFSHSAEPVEEEPVDLCDFKNLVHGHTLLQGFKDGEETAVILAGQAIPDGFVRQGKRVQRIQGDFRTADSLHQGFLEALADGHDFAGGLHLGAQAAGGTIELIKGPLRELDDHIVDGGLEAGTGFAGDIVGDLVQGIAQGKAGCDLGDRIAGSLAGQGGGAADTGIDLDDRVFEGIRIQGKLAVAAADNTDGADDIQRRGPEHLVHLRGPRFPWSRRR